MDAPLIPIPVYPRREVSMRIFVTRRGQRLAFQQHLGMADYLFERNKRLTEYIRHLRERFEYDAVRDLHRQFGTLGGCQFGPRQFMVTQPGYRWWVDDDGDALEAFFRHGTIPTIPRHDEPISPIARGFMDDGMPPRNTAYNYTQVLAEPWASRWKEPTKDLPDDFDGELILDEEEWSK